MLNMTATIKKSNRLHCTAIGYISGQIIKVFTIAENYFSLYQIPSNKLM